MNFNNKKIISIKEDASFRKFYRKKIKKKVQLLFMLKKKK